ncbi:hypothetical protein K1567_27110 [Pseudomonas sp. S5F11]|jgi:hypothetical protein|uniref:hypothetical protein n=1 Tax=Pseudomonas sp. S5F11 TaxID=2866385 RepID=UPI001C7D0E80|nr:hypothetical protein [Pseudomonas sp. S5F11]MBX4139559.1 hypothetical protein [Pseudomonas sp. S5F11]
MAQSLFEEIGLDKVSEIMAVATAKAARKADELGLPHAEEVNGKWVFRFPDGSSKPFITKGDVRESEVQIAAPKTVPASKGKVVKRHA